MGNIVSCGNIFWNYKKAVARHSLFIVLCWFCLSYYCHFVNEAFATAEFVNNE